MLTGSSLAPAGLTLRPARPADEPFLETLYRTARPDLTQIEGDPDLIETVIEQQYQVLHEGAGRYYPNAMRFVVEKAEERIGGLIVDFGHDEARVVYLAFIPAARGFGYGSAVLRGVQQAAASAGCPVSVVVWRTNERTRRLYLELGFRVEESNAIADRMTWYPGAAPARPPSVS